MTPAELAGLIEGGESARLEFKESLPSSLAKDLVAMANTSGGVILLGVRDDGTVRGVEASNTLRARIQDTARKCDPSVKVLDERVGNVLAVRVFESEAKPVQCKDGFFRRQGSMTQKLNREEIREFFHSEGVIRFDLVPCSDFKYPEDFDREKFDDWFRRARLTGNSSVEEILVNIDAAVWMEDRLVFRNAGVLFFAKNVRRFHREAFITCLLGRGTDKVHILDRKDLAGGIVSDIEGAMAFIERNTRTAYRINGLAREDVHEYPMDALREAIANAVMHRDWFFYGANVFVEIYSDRIEVSSPGSLPKGLIPAELGSRSIRRNGLIADLLHRIGFVERAGTGIRRIKDGAKAISCPEPEFEADNFVTVIFRPAPGVRPTMEAAPQDTPPAAPDTPQSTPTAPGSLTHRLTRWLTKALHKLP